MSVQTASEALLYFRALVPIIQQIGRKKLSVVQNEVSGTLTRVAL